MNEENRKAGLGKVVYSVADEEPKTQKDDATAPKATDQEVEEADEESFPASDPPAFSGAAAKKAP